VILARYTLPGSLAVLEEIVSRHNRDRADCRELVGRVAAALGRGRPGTNTAGTPS